MERFKSVSIFFLLSISITSISLLIKGNILNNNYNTGNSLVASAATGALNFNFKRTDSELGKNKNIDSNFVKFQFIMDKIKSNYVEDVDEKKLYESAINGALTSLDPHSGYMNQEEFGEVTSGIKGEFVGLGIEIIKDNSLIKIIAPIEGTPAFKVGLKSGDYISHIDDKPVTEMTLTEAVKMMRGKIGEKVKITILREHESKPLDFNIVRDVIKTKAARSEKYDNIIYLRISSFTEQAYPELQKLYLAKIKEIGEEKVEGIILDLRGNPGGLLDQSVKVSGLFLDYNDPVVSIKGRESKILSSYNSTNRNKYLNNSVPMIVLVNGGSASASEIVAGALQDNKRAIIVGTKTFGKGSVQTITPVPDGGAIKMTIARYYTPSGRSIQADGINPDILVEQDEVKFSNDNKIDERFLIKEKDLKGHLKNEKNDNKKDALTKELDNIKNKAKEEKDLYSKDYQLARAIDIIKSVNIFNKNINNKKVVNE